MCSIGENMERIWFSDYKEQILQNNLEEAKNVLLDNISEHQMIYKYCRGLNRDLQSLEKQKLWLSSAFTFNDPYDCLITVDCGLKASYPKSQRKEAMETYMRQKDENKKAEVLRSSLFVSCFSEVNNSFPLWGYYAADHKGMCLGYNLYELIKKYQCMPVIYSEQMLYYNEHDSRRNILANTLIKSSEWSHEREWRIVINDDSNIGKTGISVDFINPKEIYIGCRQQETVKENNICRCRQSKAEREMYIDLDNLLSYAERENVNVYLPMISRNEYKMIDRALILNY